MILFTILPWGATTALTESVIFHPVGQIQTSKSSWIVSSAIDFGPYTTAVTNLKIYSRNILASIDQFQRRIHLDKMHEHLVRLTLYDVNRSITEINEAHDKFSDLTGMIHNDNNRHKRSLLPLGGLFSFLFGTADQNDLDEIKKDVKTIYDNQMKQAEVLGDIVSITNVSRTLINENREKIIGMIHNIESLQESLKDVKKDLKILFTTRRFLLIHAEILIHSNRLRIAVDTLKNDINRFVQYLIMLSSGKLSQALIDPTHLQRELLSIQKQLPPTIRLPEDPIENVWHYYKYLTLNYIPLVDKIIILVKIPLVDNQSALSLYKIYNLPTFNPTIGKSVKYNIEGNSIAVSFDKNYATIPTDSEFIECTLARGHFCSLRSALYHMQTSKWCVTALFLKNDDLINENCEMSVSNVTGPEAIYLDEGNWAIATVESDQMEITCTAQKHVVSLNPPLTLVNLQPACSAFSSKLKLPPYFRKFSQGFAHAIKEANLHTDKLQAINFRIWNSLNASNLSLIQIQGLKKLDSAKAIPVKMLQAKIHLLKTINFDPNTKYWIIVGGGSGSGVVLLVIVGLCVYCHCKKHLNRKARSTSVDKSNSDSENPNMMHTRVGAIESEIKSDSGQETVGIQGSERPNLRVRLQDPMQSPGSSRLLNQLERYGADVRGHHRTLRPGTLALPSLEDHL